MGSYCGFRDHTTSTGTLTYDYLFTSVNSFSVGGLDKHTGVFTAPTHGTYLVTQNFATAGDGTFRVFINKNGHDLMFEGFIDSRSVDADWDMTGRTISLHLYKMTNYIYASILTMVEF